MKDTMFRRRRAAIAYEKCRSRLACEGPTCCAGVVHDPTARRMGGVAGPRGAVQHGRGSLDLLPHAARRRHYNGARDPRRR
jgi:hypothetical protein